MHAAHRINELLFFDDAMNEEPRGPHLPLILMQPLLRMILWLKGNAFVKITICLPRDTLDIVSHFR